MMMAALYGYLAEADAGTFNGANQDDLQDFLDQIDRVRQLTQEAMQAGSGS